MASTGEAWRLGRRPGLDGLRGVAVLLVVACHLLVPGFLLMSGQIGVTMFFTLSGFLITTLLCEECITHGGVSLRAFYARRARRLLPALYVTVAAISALSVASGTRFVTVADVIGVSLYCSNLLDALGPVSHGGALHHTWSLVLEEQFYLLWPVALLGLRRWRGVLFSLLGAACVGGVLYRAHLWHQQDLTGLIFSGPSRADELLIGCVLALALRGRPIPRISRRTTSAALGLCLVLQYAPAAFALIAGPTVAALATAVVIIGVLGETAPSFLSSRLLQSVGRASYGLYLWHHVVLWVVREGLHVELWYELVAIVVPVSTLLTWLSWRYLEQPFLRRNDRSRSSRRLRRLGDTSTNRAVQSELTVNSQQGAPIDTVSRPQLTRPGASQ